MGELDKMNLDAIFNKLGGRKLLFGFLILASGVAIELKTDRGMSMAFAGLLATVYTTFAAANAAITRKQMDSAANAALPNQTVEGLKVQVAQCLATHTKTAEDLTKLSEEQQKLGNVISELQKKVIGIVQGFLGKS